MENQKFYDIHCHAMNLSHPNFIAFLRRFEENLKKQKIRMFFQLNMVMILYLFLNSPFSRVAERITKKAGLGRIINLLALMENDLGNFFLTVEQCLRDDLLRGDQLVIGNNHYNKIVLTPLMMDFGYKYSPIGGIHYNRKPTQKPVVEQVIDIFNGIKRYSDYEVENIENYSNLFEIYPFLGINTKNYTFEKIKTMLDKYFRDYKGKYTDLHEQMGKFCGDIDQLGSNFFAGIKVYPPLGFDPWPENDVREMEKLEYLYDYCSNKQIPITAHCGGEGFITVPKEEYLTITSPVRWIKVLENFNNLKLNLAHFGGNVSPEWEKTIIELISQYDHVYTDFSYRADNALYYPSLKALISGIKDETIRNKLGKRILFGSDFSINLLESDSYCDYLGLFQRTDSFSPEEKHSFCNINPEKFLFQT